MRHSKRCGGVLCWLMTYMRVEASNDSWKSALGRGSCRVTEADTPGDWTPWQ